MKICDAIAVSYGVEMLRWYQDILEALGQCPKRICMDSEVEDAGEKTAFLVQELRSENKFKALTHLNDAFALARALFHEDGRQGTGVYQVELPAIGGFRRYALVINNQDFSSFIRNEMVPAQVKLLEARGVTGSQEYFDQNRSFRRNARGWI